MLLGVISDGTLYADKPECGGKVPPCRHFVLRHRGSITDANRIEQTMISAVNPKHCSSGPGSANSGSKLGNSLANGASLLQKRSSRRCASWFRPRTSPRNSTWRRHLLSRRTSCCNRLPWWWRPYSLVNSHQFCTLVQPEETMFTGAFAVLVGFVIWSYRGHNFWLYSRQITMQCELSLGASHAQGAVWGLCRHVYDICCHLGIDYARTQYR